MDVPLGETVALAEKAYGAKDIPESIHEAGTVYSVFSGSAQNGCSICTPVYRMSGMRSLLHQLFQGNRMVVLFVF
jgi:hypothetical protein